MRLIARFAILLLLSSLVFADIVNDVRTALAQRNSAAADSQLQTYRTQHGVDAAYLEALSWTARAALDANDLQQADSVAKETETLARQLLQKRSLDAEPHLPIALGAALEVEARVLAAHGQNAQAAALLRQLWRPMEILRSAPPAQESELAQPNQAARSAAEYIGISRHAAGSARPAQRFSCAFIFLGSLVR